MSKSGSRRLLVAGVVWLVLIGAGAVVWRYVIAPAKESDELEKTKGGVTKHDPSHEQVLLALDSFSGYCIFRSEELRKELATHKIALKTKNDEADYARRFESVRSGETPLAVFTIDALIKASAIEKKLPPAIVMLIDETVGADAMIAYKQAVPDLDALNKPEARIVLLPDSPSEMLARVALARFHLPLVPADPWIKKNSVVEVFNELRTADPKAPRAYVLWEPFVTKALDDKRAHVVMDSSSFSGYIVDVLVAQREFLLEKPDVVKAVIEAYQKVAYSQRQKAGGMLQLVTADAKIEDPDNPLTTKQAERLVQGIHWKTTEENYAHLGILQGAATQGLPNIEDMIEEITSVLLRTKAISADPTGGDPGKLYHHQILQKMYNENYHPDKSLASASGSGDGIEAARQTKPLTDQQWKELKSLGRVQVERLVFARMQHELRGEGQANLDQVIVLMGTFPQSYLLVEGHAWPIGDAEENRLLAERRAAAAAEYIKAQGVAPHRLRAVAGEADLAGGEAQSVTFVLKQMPY